MLVAPDPIPLFKPEDEEEQGRADSDFSVSLASRDELLDDRHFIIIEFPERTVIFEWFKGGVTYDKVYEFVKFMKSKHMHNFNQKFSLLRNDVVVDRKEIISGDQRQILTFRLDEESNQN